jgi:hypothetical protein
VTENRQLKKMNPKRKQNEKKFGSWDERLMVDTVISLIYMDDTVGGRDMLKKWTNQNSQ